MNESTQEKEKSARVDMKNFYRRNLYMNLATALALTMGALTIFVSIYVAFNKLKQDRPTTIAFHRILEVEHLTDQLAKQANILQEVQKKLESLSKFDDSTDIGTQLALIRADLEAYNTRVKSLENGLLENPQKALSVPLLRNDLNNLKQNYKEDISAMVKSIDRVYDQNKWFIGLMFTMAIGLIGLAISNFLQARKKPED